MESQLSASLTAFHNMAEKCKIYFNLLWCHYVRLWNKHFMQKFHYLGVHMTQEVTIICKQICSYVEQILKPTEIDIIIFNSK